MNVSHSKIELYNTCGYKYYLQYVEGYSVDKTFSALLFGLSLDRALNYVLLRKKHNHVPQKHVAEALFEKQMKSWQGQNEFEFFKYELPEGNEDATSEDQQWAAWNNLLTLGKKMVGVYIEEILPHFKKILEVQTRKTIPNGMGDNLILITDFVAELQDGRVAVFDNKSSSDITKYYGLSSVQKSQQLAIYAEYQKDRLAGYVALQKKLVRNAIKWNIVVDTIPEEQSAAVFNDINLAMDGIKKKTFDKNEKSCYVYGKKCVFWDACKKKDFSGLKKRW